MTWRAQYTVVKAAPGSPQNFGDKVSLPTEALLQLGGHLRPDQPLQLRIGTQGAGGVGATVRGTLVACGVLDFTAAEHCVCLPVWMLAALGVKEGRRVHLELTDELPKAESVVGRVTGRVSFEKLNPPDACSAVLPLPPRPTH